MGESLIIRGFQRDIAHPEFVLHPVPEFLSANSCSNTAGDNQKPGTSEGRQCYETENQARKEAGAHAALRSAAICSASELNSRGRVFDMTAKLLSTRQRRWYARRFHS